MRTLRTLVLAAVAETLLGCGQKGPLVLPDAEHPRRKIGVSRPASPAPAATPPAPAPTSAPQPPAPPPADAHPSAPVSAPVPAPPSSPPPQ